MTRSRNACTFGEYAKSMGHYLLDQGVECMILMLEKRRTFI
ncbi:Unknown protein sequence [Pseudomonas savastanoi pv. glycinea]|uniref:Uncharacterized protein n=2 Tax=Pseudomonas syringae group genomosp. 2 TaxID=251698 RepID=A0ABR5LBD8_PSESG|nr:hypothetical protein AC519_4553 [Pseudomonas savastanoi]KPB40591.1 Unknown protein sequence [Pseudomonas savastanoi pv. phaseolicola]KPB62290.1 Unknown protein sequence [Pseudomonas amygdali pv. mellea]KPB85885.1 Unknown protein sequence [Pseudomonas syringae pv. maculicola]KPB97699.1 Unknown protein sequence [Pseudomonas amygdali pv. lachrymans]KPC22092.1 Unknown protein sequence [Pseudomonas savastanoi pv. glycinea]